MNHSEHTSERAAASADDQIAQEIGARPGSRLRRFASLDLGEKLLLLRALFLVSAVRLGLFLLPFRILQRFTKRGSGKSSAVRSAAKCVWAVRAVSRYVPGATCLTQALAAQALLAQSGYGSRIEFGVRNDEHSGFLAHAWLVCGEQIVIGGAQANGYFPLEAWKTSIARIDRT